MKALTLYENFKNYTEEQVNEALKKLTEQDILILKQKYGDDFKHPRSVPKNVTDKINYLLRIVKKCLEDPEYIPIRRAPSKKSVLHSNSKFTKNILNSNIELILSMMTVEEVLDYISRLETLAQKLNIKPKDILKMKRKILEIYKESVNDTIGIINGSLSPLDNSGEKTIK